MLAPAAPPAIAAEQAPAAAPGEIIVRFEEGAGRADRANLRNRAEVDFERGLGLSGLQLVQTEPGQSARSAIRELERSEEVTYAEPNYYRRSQAVPNDTYFGLQWGLNNSGQPIGGASGVPDADIDAPQAWDLTTGAPTVIVAVIDTGVDALHPDLAPNVWTNPGESGSGRESNGLDDDNNGYVDDSSGWDWVGDDRNPADENNHGTHVAGTVGARGGDGVGVAGVGWRTRLMPLRVLDAAGGGTVSDVILAYRYAAARGARVVNLSLGGPDLSIAERDAIAAAPGTMFVAAAGNSGTNTDVVPEYPCAHTLPNVVCVAASDNSDARPPFSNYGATSVDLAAPGAQIASTVPGGWAYLSGTSMATPHVAGAAALVWALRPAATVAEVKTALLNGVDQKPAFAGTTVSGGRLNLNGSLRVATGAPATPAPGPAPAPAPTPTPTTEPSPTPAPSDPTPIADQPSRGTPEGPSLVTLPPPDFGVPESGPPQRPLRSTSSVVAKRGQRLSRVLRRGLALKARCSAPCTLQIRLGLGARTARGLGVRATTTLGRRTVRLAAGTRSLTLKLDAQARRRLDGARAATFVVLVRTNDASGVSRTVRSLLVLRR